ncbi:hypothetical protein ACWCRD_01445 [Streptomyces sp. NPDC002092]
MPKLFSLPQSQSQSQSPQCEPVRAVLPFSGAVRQRADIHRVAEIAGRGSPPASLHLGNRTDDDELRGYTE